MSVSSLQHTKPCTFRKAELQELTAQLLQHGPAGLFEPEQPPCPLCASVEAVRAAGTPVVAAVGNRTGYLSCPARSDAAVAIGLIHEERTVHVRGNVAFDTSLGETAKQPMSLHYDFAIVEADQRLCGSSFAAPLFAGLVALGLSADDLSWFARAARVESFAAQELSALRASEPPPDAQALRVCCEHYEGAIRSLPHAHLPGWRRSTTAPAAECAFCGALALPSYLNYGLALIGAERRDDALRVLQVACELAPLEADCHAALGAALRNLERLPEALAELQRAVELGNRDLHRFELVRIHNLMAAVEGA